MHAWVFGYWVAKSLGFLCSRTAKATLGSWAVRWVARSQRSLGNKCEQFPYKIVNIMNIVWEGSLPGSEKGNLGRGAHATKVAVSLRKVLSKLT